MNAYFRVMLIFETCLFKSHAIFVVCGQSKNFTPEDISCLKEGIIGRDVFEAVSKLWNDPLKINLSSHDLAHTEDIEETEKSEIVIYDE